MIKTRDASLKPGTHFEQIPLEEVARKIADSLTLEPPSQKTEPYSIPTASLRLALRNGPNEDPSRE